MTEDLETAASELEEAAAELEGAVAHLRVAAQHFRDGEVPRGCAHTFAAYGHMLEGQRHLDHRAVVHRTKSNV